MWSGVSCDCNWEWVHFYCTHYQFIWIIFLPFAMLLSYFRNILRILVRKRIKFFFISIFFRTALGSLVGISWLHGIRTVSNFFRSFWFEFHQSIQIGGSAPEQLFRIAGLSTICLCVLVRRIEWISTLLICIWSVVERPSYSPNSCFGAGLNV